MRFNTLAVSPLKFLLIVSLIAYAPVDDIRVFEGKIMFLFSGTVLGILFKQTTSKRIPPINKLTLREPDCLFVGDSIGVGLTLSMLIRLLQRN